MKKSIQMMGWVLKQVHKADRSFLPLKCLQMLVELLVVYVPILLIAPIVRQAMAKEWGMLLTLVLSLMGARSLLHYLSKVLEQIVIQRGVRVDKELINSMYLHAVEIDYASFQNAEHKSSFQRALESMNYQGSFYTLLNRVFVVIGSFLSALVSVGMTVALLMSKPTRGGRAAILAEPWLSSTIAVVAVVLLSVAVFHGTRYVAKKAREFNEAHIDVERVLMYLVSNILFAPKNYALYQTYDMFRVLDPKLQRELNRNMGYFDSIVRISQFSQLLQGAIGAVLIVLAYSIAGVKALAGAIPVAMLVTYAQSFAQLTVSTAQLTTTFIELVNMLPYQRDIREYYERESAFNTGTIPVEKRTDHQVLLSMENVSFKYPGNDEWVLRDVNITLDMNEKHAIVGPNGAGKTTFVLLLCRLFEPTEGRILLNGIDIRKYNYREYLNLFSVVFQDFQLFALTLGENVACEIDYDAERVRRNLHRSGFGSVLDKLEGVKNMPDDPRNSKGDDNGRNAHHKSEGHGSRLGAKSAVQHNINGNGGGLDTMVMSPQRDQVHFSGGEQQKIAIARALHREGSVVILDEPTAALDPISEAEIYARLNDLIEDKTSVFISHRMSSCRFCSDIIVFDEGRVVERGAHEELLANGALYHDMWQAQAAYYQ